MPPEFTDEPIVLLSTREIENVRQAAQLAVELLMYLEPRIKPGVSTLSLNNLAEAWIDQKKTPTIHVKSALLGYQGFPKVIYTNVNEAVCQGVPQPFQLLQEGDIIHLTIALQVNGYYGKTSRTFFVGSPSLSTRKLVETAAACLQRGIGVVKPGATTGDIGAEIQEYAESQGFSVVRDYAGHGIHRVLQAAPQIFHYGTRGTGKKLRSGMVFTIQPLITAGSWEVEILADQWTVVTQDRRWSAQFEHMVAVTPEGVEILTLLPHTQNSQPQISNDPLHPPITFPVPPIAPPRATTPDSSEPRSGDRNFYQPNPYDVLGISADTPTAEISQAFMQAMKRKIYSAAAIAKARKQLMNPQERLMADFLRPVLPQAIAKFQINPTQPERFVELAEANDSSDNPKHVSNTELERQSTTEANDELNIELNELLDNQNNQTENVISDESNQEPTETHNELENESQNGGENGEENGGENENQNDRENELHNHKPNDTLETEAQAVYCWEWDELEVAIATLEQVSAIDRRVGATLNRPL